ncbi:MAG: glucoamylase family protein [bacterium]|nr:glucoamylase family protein [bacterium]
MKIITGLVILLVCFHTPLPGMTDQELLLELERLGSDFFWDEASSSTGLIRDRANNEPYVVDGNVQASIASTGFGLTVLCVAHSRKWLGYDEVYNRILATLNFFKSSVQGRDGFYYHFVNIHDGSRLSSCELSSIDTTLFIAGALFAGQYFKNTEIESLADELYRKVNWAWMCNNTNFVQMGWTPPNNFFSLWDGFNEDVILDFLAIGSPTYPPKNSPKCWTDMDRPTGTFGTNSFNIIYSDPENPLFPIHYPHCWLDMRKIRYNSVNYYTNGIRTAVINRQFSSTNRNPDHNIWGAAATDNPFGGYSAYGTPPGPGYTNDGTVAPVGAGGSVMFTPLESIRCLRHMYTNYGSTIWGGNVFLGKYGFSSYLNARVSKCGGTVIGIDQGAIVLSIENYLSGMVWDVFMQIPYIQTAMKTMGFIAESDISGPSSVNDLAVYGNRLEWTAPSDNSGKVKRYEIRYGTRKMINLASWNDGTELVQFLEPKQAGSRESLMIEGVPEGNYYLALRSGDEAGNKSLLSNPTEKVVIYGISDKLLQNFPNPASDKTAIRFLLQETSDVELNAYSLSGRMVREWDLKDQGKGYHQFDWDLKDNDHSILGPGIYTLILRINNTRAGSIKVIIVR